MRPAGSFSSFSRCIAQTTAQKSVLWWAANHRDHHLHSDTELDVHSPRHFGFIYSHVGWIFSRRQNETNFTRVADLAKYPELMWLHRYELAPPFALALVCFAVAGWPGLIVGFFWSTVAVYHATFCINSIAHLVGRGATSPATIPATIGFSPSSPWARAGTTITMPTRAALARDFTGGNMIRPSIS